MTLMNYPLKWLNDAHAMEQALVKIMDKQVARLETYPELRQRLNAHLQDTHWQTDQLRKELERFDHPPSSAKDAVMKMEGIVLTITHTAFEDEVIKDVLANFAAENYEIICYQSLITTFRELREHTTVRVCEEILEQEEEMARWLQNHAQPLLREFLEREHSQTPHKR